MGKKMLPPDGGTTPMEEFHGLSAAGNIKIVLEKVIDGWLYVIHTGSDSEIALMWVQYEHLKLEVFQRNQAINARMKLDLGDIYHVCGSEMPADAVTKPSQVNKSTLLPNSSWFLGKPCLLLSVEEDFQED